MKLLYGSHLPNFPQGSVATIGNFDGVHLGHQALLKRLKAKACQLNKPLVVILFEPQPLEYFAKSTHPMRLSSLRDKLLMLQKCAVDYVYCLKFNQQMANLSPEAFMQTYLYQRLHVRFLLIGRDFRFGFKRRGDVEMLRAFGHTHHMEVAVLNDHLHQQTRISSTDIRHLLKQNKLNQAKALLGRAYDLQRKVIRGKGLARTWGFPTANCKMGREFSPLAGVYCVRVTLCDGRLYSGVANIGCRPTVQGQYTLLEVHLFNFNETLYHQSISVAFLHKLRDEIKFASIDLLIAQIKQDILQAQALFDAPDRIFDINNNPTQPFFMTT